MAMTDLLDRVRSTGGTPDRDPESADLLVPDDASELDDSLPPDPKPGKRTARRRIPRPAAAPAKATAVQKRQIEDSLVLLMTVIGGGISLRDRVCGPAITSNAQQVARAAVPIIARNPALMAWFCGGAGFMDIFGLIVALQPVIGTAWGHHVTKSTGHDGHDHGSGEGVPVDYSAFTAPVL